VFEQNIYYYLEQQTVLTIYAISCLVGLLDHDRRFGKRSL